MKSMNVLFSCILFLTFSITINYAQTKSETKVAFMRAGHVTIQKQIVGYGTVVPAREWSALSEVKGKIICIGFSLFRAEDIKNAKNLILHLKTGEDTLDKYILQQLYPEELLLLKEYNGASSPNEELTDTLLAALNRTIRGKLLYEHIPPKVRPTSKVVLQSHEIIKLNRMALQDAFSEYILPYSFLFEIQEGRFAPQGAVICQIDPREYEIIIQQKQIALQKYEIQRKELEKDVSFLQETLNLEEKRTALLESEYKRKEKLLSANAVSPAEMEKTLNELFRQTNTIQDLKNRKELSFLKIKNLQASQILARTELEQARMDRNKTVITAPFNLRISMKNVEINQYVVLGQKLLEGFGLEKAEILAQYKIGDLRYLMMGADLRFDLQQYLATGQSDALERFKMKAIVSVSADTELEKHEILWDGQTTRVSSSLNPYNQTATVVIVVDDPYKDVVIGVRPPLMKGMRCQATIYGEKMPSQICLPKRSYHQGKVMIINQNNRLEFRKVDCGFCQQEFVIVRQGINPEERVVVDDIKSLSPNILVVGEDKTAEIFAAYPSFVSVEKKE